jgi:hypothetical protein
MTTTQKTKPCKLCSSKRYGNLSICFKHYNERKKSKREEKLAKAKARKEGTKKFATGQIKATIKRLDTLWSAIVRHQRRCDLCGNTGELSDFDAHHLRSRRNMATRFYVGNGACLCKGCHRYGVHQDTWKAGRLIDHLKERRGPEWWTALCRRADSVFQPTAKSLSEIETNLNEIRIKQTYGTD